MQKWLSGGVLTAAAFGSVYLATPPAKVDAPAPVVAAADPFTRTAPTPVDFAPPPVVDVTDIGPLLDPPAVPLADPAGDDSPVSLVVGEDAPPVPAAGRAPAFIPPAAD